MQKIKQILAIVFALVMATGADAQDKYPRGYFRSPVDFRILIAGSFAEVRPNHFHSGIDIRTGGEEGKPVYAAADGYVSRINISAVGFGNAIYITHPNGYVTVYGHLRNYNETIGAWIRSRQYKQESFEIDIPVEPGVLKVKKGEIIAYSGNSGSSGGPHLHFEIREAASQEAINPILFGIPVTDNIPPEISSVKIYPFDEMSMVNFASQPLALPIARTGSGFVVQSKDTVKVSGKIYFAVQATDRTNDDSDQTGINSVELYVDSVRHYSHSVNRFAFSETRYVNALLDYPAAISRKQRFQRSYVALNNKMGIYKDVHDRGIVSFMDNKAHKITYVVRDPSGNASRLVFWVKSHLPAPGRAKPVTTSGATVFSCLKANHWEAEGIRLDLPEDALYEDLNFKFSVKPSLPGTFSRTFSIQDDLTPLHKACTLSIRTDNLPKKLASKALIVRVGESRRFSSCGGVYKDGVITVQIREFGNYSVAVDTVPPKIIPVNIAPGKSVSKMHSFSLKISDNLSGIKFYRGTINGKWILMNFDAKRNLLTYIFDDRLHGGKNEFSLTVRDAAGNESIYKATLYR